MVEAVRYLGSPLLSTSSFRIQTTFPSLLLRNGLNLKGFEVGIGVVSLGEGN